MKTALKTAALLSALSLCGCASILSDSSYPVTIKSTPSDSSFTITNKKGEKIHSGNTPATINLQTGAGFFSGEKYYITFEKPGYESTKLTVDTTLDGWYIGNLLFGGPIGFLIVDPATGAMWKLPESAFAQLSKTSIVDETAQAQLQIMTLEDTPLELRDQLQELKALD